MRKRFDYPVSQPSCQLISASVRTGGRGGLGTGCQNNRFRIQYALVRVHFIADAASADRRLYFLHTARKQHHHAQTLHLTAEHVQHG